MTSPNNMTPPNDAPDKNSPTAKKFTGKKAFMWIAGFFLVVFTVNGIMTYIALGTWGGLQTEDAYRKGLYYNQEISAAEAQKASGWEISLQHSPKNLTGGRLDVEVTWPKTDLPPAAVSAFIGRAVTDVHDQRVTLAKTGNNIYTAPLSLPLAGQWNIVILVKRPEGPIYQLKDKIYVTSQNEK